MRDLGNDFLCKLFIYILYTLFVDFSNNIFYTLIMKEILRTLRNEKNYSQSAVASYLEISRQMYNKYEKGTAEPSLKNIKKLCELYKVSADIFFQNELEEKSELYSYESENLSGMSVASPAPYYGPSSPHADKNNLLAELIKLLPLLQLSEQISLMSRLARIIENQTSVQNNPVIKTKKIKKIPDANYNNYLNSKEAKKIRNASLASIREMLQDDEW